MQNITSVAALKETIQLLEIEQSLRAQALKDQWLLTFEKLKPVNLIKNSFKDAISAPHLIENIISTAVGLGTGFFAKKIVVGTSFNIFRSLFGSALQVGVTNAIAQHPDALKSVGQYLFKHIFRKKEHIA